MSGTGAWSAEVRAPGARVAIVASSWHTIVMNGLVAGAQRACDAAGASYRLFTVPGSFELPIVAQACATSGDYDVVAALGVVIRGGTPHFDYVCDAATAGLTRVALDTGVPIGFGLLTCDTDAQALDRAGLDGSKEDKGKEAVNAALATWLTLREVGSAPSQ